MWCVLVFSPPSWSCYFSKTFKFLSFVCTLKSKRWNGRAESKRNVAFRKWKFLFEVFELRPSKVWKCHLKTDCSSYQLFQLFEAHNSLVCPFKILFLFFLFFLIGTGGWMAIAVPVLTGVLPNIPRRSCCIMRNNWRVSWMTWCLAFCVWQLLSSNLCLRGV